MASNPKIQPSGNRVLVQQEEAEEMTKGGLYIPATANDDKKPGSGIVIKLGEGTTKSGKAVKFNVKVGDRIVFKKYSPEEIEVDGETFLLVENEDILAVVK